MIDNKMGELAMLAFMGVVTAWLLAMAIGSLRTGAGPLELLVYGGSAGFGLQFLGAAWSEERTPRR